LEKRSAGERSRWLNFTFFIFPGTVLPKFILEVLFPEKCRRESSLSRASAPALAQYYLFLFFRVQYFQNAFWKYCSRKNVAPSPRVKLIAGERSSAGPILPFLFLFFRVQYFHFFIFP